VMNYRFTPRGSTSKPARFGGKDRRLPGFLRPAVLGLKEKTSLMTIIVSHIRIFSPRRRPEAEGPTMP
jgi:hypothetical protein